ncbi:hypothetical protein [Yoonia vestfoldensis]|uniref:hypothetical protein n=1 Tax=Yoonia vestfoldensis TaxID=245188 RepID=UPI0012FFC8F4|nr:hypothetical protein [Yoonia vestfoldensis]
MKRLIAFALKFFHKPRVGPVAQLVRAERSLRISELPDSYFAKSRTAISVITGQFGRG